MAVDTTVASSTGESPKGTHGPLFRFLFVHEIDEYPDNKKRTAYLALAVLATVVLYYTYFTQTGVTPNILEYYHMSFSFYVGIVIVSNLIGAFASLPASKTDKLGRSNVVIYGLLLVGALVTWGIPAATTEWQFAIAVCGLGLIEGAILVATPALVRDFSPQLGRATAMGFWTIGPVAGSLLTSIVATNTLKHFVDWQSQFVISGISSLVVFVLALFLMKDLSPRLREQLMVTQQDQALAEARARGLSDAEVLAATSHPWRQIFKWDLIGYSLGISLSLLIYFAASAFFTIYWATVFKNPSGLNFTTVQANSLNQWYWGADAVTLIIFGVLSDKLKVRKPFLLVGSIGSIVMLILFLGRATHPYTGFDTLIPLEILLATFISMTYAPWMASYTEMVEEKNPALVGTGLALWGWILRLTVGISFIFLPIVVNSVNPVVNNLPLATPQVQEFLVQHADSVAFAQKHAELLTLVQKHEAVVERASVDPSLPNLLAVAAAIGTKNALELNSLKAQFEKLVVPYQKQLSYLSAHQKALTQLQNGVNKSPKQWQHWFWICIGGIILFIPTIFINRGRWSPKRAREDEEKRKAEADAELKTLVGAGV